MDAAQESQPLVENEMAKLTGFSLSFKVLVMTVLVVMLMQVLVYVPSVVSFERYEIENRVRAASVAAHAVTTYPDSSVPQNIQVDLLHQLDAYALVLQQNGTKMLVAVSDSPPMVTHDIALPHGSFVDLAKLAFDTIFDGSGHTVRAIAPYGDGGEIELVFSGESLRRMLLAFSARVLFFSLIMSTITAILVFVTIRSKLIIPFKRLGLLLDSWSQDPEGSSYLIQHTGRRDEIGLAELGLARIQQRLQELFKQQRRLAELGLAVSKINHDLRNILASAQLISDRMSTIPDPSVQRFAPKLVSTIDRAVNYCQSVLAYGKAQEPPPSRRLVALSRLAEDVASVTGLQSHGVIDWVNAVPETLEVDADSEQLFRVLLNLVRNSMQAMEQNGDDSVVRRLTVSAERKASLVRIVVADTGPGLPPKAREALFKPFQGSVRRGGTGLGLAIAAELVRAHGGTIAALENGPGATFVIEIPDRDAAPA